MFEDKIMKKIGKVILLGLIAYVVILLLDDTWRLNYFTEAKRDYVTAQVDSTIPVRQLNPIVAVVDTDTLYVPPTLSALVARVDSDSLKRYNLHRDLQEVVTIDMEEHKEAVFFTWEDVKAYSLWIIDKGKNIINKKSNDNN